VGATVNLASLPRHTGNAQEFLRSRSWQYLREGERAVLAFWEERRTPIVLGGYSTGALLALVIAARHPDKVAALVLASPSLRLSRTEQQLVGYTVSSAYYVVLPLALMASLLGVAYQHHRKRWARGRVAIGALGSIAVFTTATLGLRALTVPLSHGGPITRGGEEVLPPQFARASLLGGSTLVPLQLAARWRLRRLRLPVCLVFGEEDQVVDVRFGTMRAARNTMAELHVVPRAPHRVVSVAECHDKVCAFVERAFARQAAVGQPLD
jgi:pimeloyl-ACP methyl ester carboxylesterase